MCPNNTFLSKLHHASYVINRSLEEQSPIPLNYYVVMFVNLKKSLPVGILTNANTSIEKPSN